VELIICERSRKLYSSLAAKNIINTQEHHQKWAWGWYTETPEGCLVKVSL